MFNSVCDSLHLCQLTMVNLGCGWGELRGAGDLPRIPQQGKGTSVVSGVTKAVVTEHMAEHG